ncbi:MAG: hypothetical protein KGY53_09470 [Wenzhouxiangellaceae bacterium]|nr:hypothetical protein [Wenzhouxiangellaceae bacterium]
MRTMHARWIPTVLAALLLAASSLAISATAEDSERPDRMGNFPVNGQPVAGLWATTGFLDPALAPDLEGGPLLQGLLLLHPNGTVEWDTTAASGLHPAFPFARAAPTVYGTWSVVNGGVRIETYNYTPGITGAGELGRQTWQLGFPIMDGTMEGQVVADVLPCVAGLLRCPNPAEVGPVEFPQGEEDRPPVAPVVLQRIPFPQP